MSESGDNSLTVHIGTPTEERATQQEQVNNDRATEESSTQTQHESSGTNDKRDSVSGESGSSSDSDDEDEKTKEKEEEDWQGWDEEHEISAALCLFCPHHAPTSQIWQHMQEQHNFNFYGIKAQKGLDFYDCIRLINFIRLHTKQGKDAETTIQAIHKTPKWLTSDEYLKPVIEDDPLLFELDDEDSDSSSDSDDGRRKGEKKSNKQTKPKKQPADPMAALEKTNRILREQLEDAQTRIRQMQLAMQRLVDDADEKTIGSSSSSTSDINPHDEGYFENYSARNIHEIMLRDKTRTLAYRDFILENKSLFEGKTVLDVGCGTGILCLFAAQAGAKQVIGVDAADIIDKAKIICEINNYSHIITFVKSKIEEAVLPVEKVDIIISEWMGYFLLFESMLPSVLFARDKWLVQDGLVYPNQATMFIAGARVAKKETVESFWKDVYGFDMRTLVDEKEVQVSCDVDDVAQTKICTSSATIKQLDILTCRAPDLEFTTPFELNTQQESLLDSLVVWFDTLFQHDSNPKSINLTTAPTSPSTPLTHWFQTVFYLHEHIALKQGDVVVGSIKAVRGKECDRSYEVKLTYGLKGGKSYVQEFTV